MAFPLMAIGAGIGRFADSLMEQRRQQQEQAMQRLRMQLEMQRFAQELGLKREQLGLGQLGAALSNPFGGGGTGFGAPGGSGGSNAGLGMGPVPGAPSSFAPPVNVMPPGMGPGTDLTLPPGVFGGAYSDTGTRSGGREGASPQSRMPATPDAAAGLTPGPGDPRAMLPFIRGDAARYGVDPDVAERVARSEGLGSFAGDSGTSFGAFQLHRGGGLGDTFQRQTGLDPSNPQNEPATIDFALRNVASTGWLPYHGAARVGVGPRQGIGGDTQVAQANTGTMSDAGPQLPPLPPPPNPQQIYQQTLTDAQRYGLNPNTPIGQALISKGAIDRYKAQMTMWQAQVSAQRAASEQQRFGFEQKKFAATLEQQKRAGYETPFNAQITAPDGSTTTGMAYNRKGESGFYDAATGQKFPPGTKVQKVSGQQAELPPEVKFPEKWEGMPNKPPPGSGLRQDIWDGALYYAQTGQMPTLGLGASKIRDQIYAAEPAARQALGIEASGLASTRAQYAGERHGNIVLSGRLANLETSINEAKKLGPAVVTASANVPRTDLGPFFNRFVTGAKLQTGDPNIVAFQGALNSFLNTYARGINPTGRMTDSQQNHAYEVLNTAMAAGQIERGIRQLTFELDMMKSGLGEAVQDVPQMFRPPALRGPGQPEPQDPSLSPQQPAAPAQGGGATLRYDAQGNRIQ